MTHLLEYSLCLEVPGHPGSRLRAWLMFFLHLPSLSLQFIYYSSTLPNFHLYVFPKLLAALDLPDASTISFPNYFHGSLMDNQAISNHTRLKMTTISSNSKTSEW